MSPDEEGTLTGARGVPLHWELHRPRAQPTGVVINVCGLGDHSGLYPMVTTHLPARGLAVYALDTRGNGQSGSKRGHVDRWDDFREDLHRMVAFVRGREAGSLTLLGHSLGGLMVLDYVLAHPGRCDRVAAASPPLGSIGTSPLLVGLAHLLSRIAPGITLESGLDLSGLAHDPAIIDAVTSDPLFHRRASGRLATETFATAARVHAGANAFREPVLIMHGDEDGMVSIDGSRRLAREGPHRVKLIEYPGARHALFADTGWQQRIDDLVHWIAATS